MFWLCATTLTLLFTGLVVGCGDDTVPTCVPGETQDCTCADLREGVQTCEDDGTFAACVCSGDDMLTCVPGETRDCTCEDLDRGVQACLDDGTYEVCDCYEPPSCDGVTVEPNPLDFGPTEIGRGASWSLSIGNEGLVPVRLERVAWDPESDEEFRMETLPPALQQPEGYIELQSGEGFSFQLYFSPVAETTNSARILVETSCGVFSVLVTGAGIPRPEPVDDLTGIWIQMTWETPGDLDRNDTGGGAGTDVGLHFLHPNGVWDMSPWDCHWKNKNPNWGNVHSEEDDPQLDIDDTDGWGPENITLKIPEGTADDPFTYKVGAFYFSDREMGPSDVTIEIYLDGELSLSHTYIGLENRQFWDVARVTWPSGETDLIDTMYPSGFP